eukprot:3680112-Prymnesium_polylepis.1
MAEGRLCCVLLLEGRSPAPHGWVRSLHGPAHDGTVVRRNVRRARAGSQEGRRVVECQWRVGGERSEMRKRRAREERSRARARDRERVRQQREGFGRGTLLLISDTRFYAAGRVHPM